MPLLSSIAGSSKSTAAPGSAKPHSPPVVDSLSGWCESTTGKSHHGRSARSLTFVQRQMAFTASPFPINWSRPLGRCGSATAGADYIACWLPDRDVQVTTSASQNEFLVRCSTATRPWG